MYHILIVDDNKNNRMIVRLLLDDYQEENGSVVFEIDEAENGAIAVENAKNKHYDLIFMDIMMPELNGIDATKAIRKGDKKVMIVAVSAIDDVQRQKEILTGGAEDYISKPINADIFNSRLGNYLSLIDARHHQKRNKEALNLFTQKVFSRRLIFMMGSEESLAEFWEYYLLSDTLRSEALGDLVRVVFTLCDWQRRAGIQSEVVVEESEMMRYFTVTHMELLDSDEVNGVLEKNGISVQYKRTKERITFALPIEAAVTEREVPVAAISQPKIAHTAKVTQVVPIVSTVPIEPKETLMPEPVVPSGSFGSAQELHVFDYMDHDDLDEVELYMGKLSSLLLIVGSSDIEVHEVEEICAYLAQIAKILRGYNESYRIALALDELSAVIAQHIDTFRENSGALGPMAHAFSNDLISWQRMIFHDGAPSVDFLDDTISANAQMIGVMLSPDQGGDAAGDLDDIFDF
ncbi:MAG: response regulator [Campylobacterales bacterium]|nr:response regulator [Campylobacterales bacterium]